MLRCMHPRATLAATILGSSLAFIDGSVVNVALPALAHDLEVNPANLTWAINAYLLPLGVLILLGGALGDHFGRRRLFQIGLCTFTFASLVCAAAGALAGALGPIVGGWVVDTVGWRTIFLLNLPIAAAAGYLAWKYVEERKASSGAAPLDAAGAGLATAALGLLTWALTKASESSAAYSSSWSAAIGGI